MESEVFPTGFWVADYDSLPGSRDTGVQGTVTFHCSEGVQLDIPAGVLVDTRTKISEGHFVYGEPKETAAVYGGLVDGRYCTLRHVSVGSSLALLAMGHQQQKLIAQSMIVSDEPVDFNPVVSRVVFSFPALRTWSKGSPIRGEQVIDSKGFFNRYSCAVDAKDMEPLKLYEANDCQIEVIRKVSELGSCITNDEVHLVYQCELAISFNRATQDFDTALHEWVVPIWNLISFLSCTRSSISSVEFTCADSGVHCAYYAPFLGKEEMSDKDCRDQAPFSLDGIGSRISEVIERWFGADGDLKRGADIVIGLLDEWSMPINLQFVACASSLEALSRVGRDDEEFPKEELARRLQVVQDSTDIDSKTKGWVRYRLQNGGNRKPADELAKGLFDTLGDYASYIVPDAGSFLKDHRTYRNAYVHQNEDILSDPRDLECLYDNTWATWFLCYGAIAQELGFEPLEIVNAMKNSRYKSGLIQRARKRYALSE